MHFFGEGDPSGPSLASHQLHQQQQHQPVRVATAPEASSRGSSWAPVPSHKPAKAPAPPCLVPPIDNLQTPATLHNTPRHAHTHTHREAALQAAKVETSKDWSPEYVPPSILPDRFKKGQFLRKASCVSPAMILKVGGQGFGRGTLICG